MKYSLSLIFVITILYSCTSKQENEVKEEKSNNVICTYFDNKTDTCSIEEIKNPLLVREIYVESTENLKFLNELKNLQSLVLMSQFNDKVDIWSKIDTLSSLETIELNMGNLFSGSVIKELLNNTFYPKLNTLIIYDKGGENSYYFDGYNFPSLKELLVETSGSISIKGNFKNLEKLKLLNEYSINDNRANLNLKALNMKDVYVQGFNFDKFILKADSINNLIVYKSSFQGSINFENNLNLIDDDYFWDLHSIGKLCIYDIRNSFSYNFKYPNTFKIPQEIDIKNITITSSVYNYILDFGNKNYTNVSVIHTYGFDDYINPPFDFSKNYNIKELAVGYDKNKLIKTNGNEVLLSLSYPYNKIPKEIINNDSLKTLELDLTRMKDFSWIGQMNNLEKLYIDVTDSSTLVDLRTYCSKIHLKELSINIQKVDTEINIELEDLLKEMDTLSAIKELDRIEDSVINIRDLKKNDITKSFLKYADSVTIRF